MHNPKNTTRGINPAVCAQPARFGTIYNGVDCRNYNRCFCKSDNQTLSLPLQ